MQYASAAELYLSLDDMGSTRKGRAIYALELEKLLHHRMVLNALQCAFAGAYGCRVSGIAFSERL